ncbi:MAG TPA: DNA gyrase inhibitor YacG [Candidatus Limnocylindria bacterium]|nr:DNA gyrase inhibitor YacG [Candidatus Limnocylindria bacterium]
MPRTVKCPTCRKEVAWANNPHRPFCSDRCQLIDFGAWTEERYKIPGDEIEIHCADDDDDDKKHIN